MIFRTISALVLVLNLLCLRGTFTRITSTRITLFLDNICQTSIRQSGTLTFHLPSLFVIRVTIRASLWFIDGTTAIIGGFYYVLTWIIGGLQLLGSGACLQDASLFFAAAFGPVDECIDDVT